MLYSWFLVPGARELSMKIYIYAADISKFLFGALFRKSIKKLVLKNLNSSNLFSPVNRENEDLASPSEYPENGDRYVDSSCRCLYLRGMQTGYACL